MADVIAELKALRLHGMAATWAELGEQRSAEVERSRWLLEHMLQAEASDRATRSVQHRLRRRQDDHGAAGPAHAPLPHRGDWQRKLPRYPGHSGHAQTHQGQGAGAAQQGRRGGLNKLCATVVHSRHQPMPAPSPGSKFNRQGGSNLDRRQQDTDKPARAGGGLSVYTKFCAPSVSECGRRLIFALGFYDISMIIKKWKKKTLSKPWRPWPSRADSACFELLWSAAKRGRHLVHW